MPNYPTFARFAQLRDADIPAQGTSFVQMPDGSLIMTNSAPQQAPSMLDRLRAAASRVIGMGRSGGSPEVPWWIAQPAPAAEPAPSPQPTGKVDPWADVAREAGHEQAISDQLSNFSQRVMASPELIEGKWFSR